MYIENAIICKRDVLITEYQESYRCDVKITVTKNYLQVIDQSKRRSYI